MSTRGTHQIIEVEECNRCGGSYLTARSESKLNGARDLRCDKCGLVVVPTAWTVLGTVMAYDKDDALEIWYGHKAERITVGDVKILTAYLTKMQEIYAALEQIDPVEGLPVQIEDAVEDDFCLEYYFNAGCGSCPLDGIGDEQLGTSDGCVENEMGEVYAESGIVLQNAEIFIDITTSEELEHTLTWLEWFVDKLEWIKEGNTDEAITEA